MKKSLKDTERLLPPKRYAIALQEILEYQEVYLLQEKENAYAVSEFEGKTLIAIWSQEVFAEANAENSWADFRPKSIHLSDLEPILDFIEDKGWLLDVFPVGGKTGEVVTVEEFIRDLNELVNNSK